MIKQFLTMTEKSAKYGCLSKSLDRFLRMKESKRKEKYGKNAAKYFERIIKGINGSFKDHITVISRLPEEYRKQIDFLNYCDGIITMTVQQKWYTETPERVLKETLEHMYQMRIKIEAGQLNQLAGKDFQRVIDWLEYFNLQKDPRFSKNIGV